MILELTAFDLGIENNNACNLRKEKNNAKTRWGCVGYNKTYKYIISLFGKYSSIWVKLALYLASSVPFNK